MWGSDNDLDEEEKGKKYPEQEVDQKEDKHYEICKSRPNTD